jgi:hypothetical protein
MRARPRRWPRDRLPFPSRRVTPGGPRLCWGVAATASSALWGGRAVVKHKNLRLLSIVGPAHTSMRARTVISWRMPGTDHWSSAATTASISAPISTLLTRPADSSGASAAAPASAPRRAPRTAPVCTFSPPRFAFASRAPQTSPPPFFAAERTFGTLCSRYQLTIVGWRGTRMPSADAMASARDDGVPTP